MRRRDRGRLLGALAAWLVLGLAAPSGAVVTIEMVPIGDPGNAGDPAVATQHGGVGNVTDVGSYTASASPYGTFDQGGNVFEWNEAIIGGSNRGIRGGSWSSLAINLAASIRLLGVPTNAIVNLGFRVASPPSPLVPAMSPGSVILMGLVFAGLLAWKRRA